MSRARTLASLALTCALLAVPAAAAHAQDCPGADTPAAAGNEAQLNQATLCLLNAQRASAGLPALAENAQLDQTATAFSQQMVAEQFFDHTSPEGATVVDRLTAAGYLPGEGAWTAGENIAWGQGTLATPQSIMTAWMNSAGHRANILSPDYTDVGLGVAIGTPNGGAIAGATYTTDFGHHVAPASDPAPSAPAQQPSGVVVTVKGKRTAHRRRIHHRRRVVMRCATGASTGRTPARVTHGMRLCRTAPAHRRR